MTEPTDRSRLRVRLVVLALAVTVLSACGADARTADPDVIRIEAPSCDARDIEPGHRVFRDAESFAAFWNAHCKVDVPEVDFGKYFVVGVFAGERPNPGYGIRVQAAEVVDGTLHVVTVEYTPPPDKIFPQVIVYPFDLAKVPRVAGEVVVDDTGEKGGS